MNLENGLQRDEAFGQYFKEQVRRELVERFGWGRVSIGGLRVYTTIDARMQQAAEKALEAGLVAIEQRKRYKHTTREQFLAEAGGVVKDGVRPPYLQGGLVALDPGNLYRVVKRLLADGLVAEAGQRSAPDEGGERRRYYRLTALGGRVLAAELERLRTLVNAPGTRALSRRWS